MALQYYVDPAAGGGGSGTIGSPFQSLSQARNALYLAFQTATDDYVINCLAGEDPGSGVSWALGGSGGTTRKLTVRAEGVNRHTGVRGTGYRLPVSLQFYDGNPVVTLELIGIAAKFFNIDGNANLIVQGDACLCYDSTNSQSYYLGGGTQVWRNSVSLQSNGDGFMAENNSSTPDITLINCTSLGNSTNGFRRTGGSLTLLNCYSGGNGTAPYSGTITRTNCAHDTAGVFAGSVASIAYSTANFANVTSSTQDGKLVTGSAVLGIGVGPASNALVPAYDFEGTVRGGSSTDIGFDQRIGYVVPTPAVLEFEGFRFRNDDGTEITATWKSAQNANASFASAVNARLRVTINCTSGGPLTQRLRLQGRKVGDANWKDVP